ncbi:MAG: protein kinase [Acidimicrobiia bacterium]
MAAKLPDRYQLEIRLGRDGDIEEWLANDSTLDRPVLVRLLGPEVGPARREEFLVDVKALAGVGHPHLVEIYAAGTDGASTWMVGEWTGGVTIADRLEAGQRMPVEEFLPNAAGLASALGALHEAGQVHGAIDTHAVTFSAAHPAKLTSFARTGHGLDPAEDVSALALVLQSALTGLGEAGPPPSQLTDGIHPLVDEALDEARKGEISAVELAARLRSSPTSPAPPRTHTWGWRWLAPAAGLLALGLGIIALGPFGHDDDVTPFDLPDPPVTTIAATTTTSTTLAPLEVLVVDVLDPSQDGERDSELPNLTDGDITTSWRTERYFAPIQLIKPGVGVTFVLNRMPSRIEFDASEATGWEVRWAATLPADIAGWETIASGVVPAPSADTGAHITAALPARRGGFWLLWLTQLTPQGQSDDDPPRDFYYSFIYEVRFST